MTRDAGKTTATAGTAGEEASADGGPGFVHLHLHSEYSLLDGGNRVKRLVDRVKELGMDAVAVTDHGNLHAAFEFHAAARMLRLQVIEDPAFANEIPAEEVDSVRAMAAEVAKSEGKPDKIIDKIVEGRMRKYFEQNSLLMQSFVKDPDKTIGELLGEGLEARIQETKLQVTDDG